ncbi:prolyl oligopeptidase family serine peptidase [Ponticaulis sp.]|uniref:prolyl oligopeptidase family serine peptidase n=1 Tax=Ponticaulis sp. TaxID=2020902 RepID=UPI000B64D3EF|nr:prolyl oligopeptidase family serine peptidase [Ponticaulis sp.]MAJ09189.1 S9 family peptidase [Ponticaulis sp.]HBJ92091.1 S9 family peptidase [Hyphomonadaceae bacterium]
MAQKLFTSLAAAALLAVTACSEGDPVAPESDTADTETSVNVEVDPNGEDPNIWLEEVEGERALDWVRAQNDRTLGHLQATDLYNELQAEAEAIVNASERIPYGSVRDGMVYNFWQDADNVRGLWRRTSLESYATEEPEWETIINFDELAAEEDANWVYKGASCHNDGESERWTCMVSLSDGGKDAAEMREFDLTTLTWVEDGFYIPEAKAGTAWVDYDTMLIATDWGGDGSTLTESGYPTEVRRWTRGTPLEEAETIFTGDRTDVGIWPFTLELADGTQLEGVTEADTFFTSKYFVFPNGGTEALELPLPAKSSIVGSQWDLVFVTLQEDWTVEHEGEELNFSSGSLVAINAAMLEDGELGYVWEVFAPNERQSIESVALANEALLIAINDNVSGQILTAIPDRLTGEWTTSPLDLPENGALGIVFANQHEDTVFINYEGFLTPDTLMSYNAADGEITELKSLPGRFDTEGLVVEQFEAESTDGTMIPYFIVHREDIPLDGTTPTLLYGYGGFQISMTPSYSALRGKLWLERGGAYVLANIRGGGEFGPAWHQAGLKTERQIVYDDFIAVAEDLIDRGVTTSDHLGIQGGSNGGLLMGVMLTQRPDLWDAVVVQVPLLDMLRYHLLLAGASWVDEYGSPDIPEEREWLEQVSPYHNFDQDADYPTPFFMTSTKDDRVHPGHARKMAYLFDQAGMPFYYYENIDGGHSAAANLQEAARRVALEVTYLSERLMD